MQQKTVDLKQRLMDTSGSLDLKCLPSHFYTLGRHQKFHQDWER